MRFETSEMRLASAVENLGGIAFMLFVAIVSAIVYAGLYGIPVRVMGAECVVAVDAGAER